MTILNFRYVPRYMFDRNFFPNYFDGGSGYVFTMKTATKLYNASMEIPLIHLEDAYFTGRCTAAKCTASYMYRMFTFLLLVL